MSGSLASLAGSAIGLGAVGGTLARFLRPASIRGVGFWIVGAEDEVVRRWITHEFPGRDDPWHEDLGAGPQAFSVEGLVIGDDAPRQAERIRKAALAAGPARLVHPWYGTLQVVILGAQVSQAVNERRVARFQLKLEKAGRAPAPNVIVSLANRLLAAVDAVADAVGEVLAEIQMSVAAVDQALGTVLGIASGVAGAASRGLSGAGLASALSGTATAQAIAGLAGISASEASSPAAIAARTDALAAAIAAQPAPEGNPNAALNVLLALGAADLVAVPTDRSTPERAEVADLMAAIAAALACQFAARAAAAALDAAWATREDAMADRARLAEVLETGAEAAAAIGWDDTWRQMLALRSTTLEEIAIRAAPLPQLRRISLPGPIPASLLAYALDGDALGTLFERGAAIAARNRAQHPGFLPAQRAIEVIL